MKNLSVIVSVFLLIGLSFSKTTIKFATLAPEGSTWMQVMKEFSEAVKKETDGRVRFKIYPGGVQGDEKDVLRKMRINLIHSAGFTGVGLGEILPEVRILDAPFLFKNHSEVDYVTEKFFDKFAQKFEQKNYILLGWAEVGFVYIYTNKQVKSIDDIKGVKMWMWEGDPLARATFRAFGIHPTPLSITDVMTSLQTGLIDGVYTAPLACVALQWFTKIKYVIDIPLANSNGAVLVSKKTFAKLSAEDQAVVREKGRFFFGKLTRLSRKDNQIAIQKMSERGIVKINFNSPDDRQKIEQIGKQARQDLAGKLYSKELLAEVEQAVEEFRAKKTQK